MATFELRDVTVERARRRLVDRVSLSVEAGEVLVVMGANGAGKSTLLHLMSGDFAPDSGAVHMNGEPLRDRSIIEQARQRAVLPQQTAMSFAFTAFEVVLLGRSPHHGGQPGELDRAIAREALRRTDALQFADRSYPTLSGGERARVMLARAFAQVLSDVEGTPSASGARTLLLDEPSAALDIAHQHAAFAAIRTMATRSQVAVVAVLHDPDLAAFYADRVALMKDGRLIALGTVDETMTEKSMSDCFSVAMKRLRHPARDLPLMVAMPWGSAGDAQLLDANESIIARTASAGTASARK